MYFSSVVLYVLVLSNIIPSILVKLILQLSDFEPVIVIVKSGDFPGTSKQGCSHVSSDHDLTLLKSDVNLVYEVFC